MAVQPDYDFTTTFTTDLVFDTKEEMVEWAKETGKMVGLVVVTRSAANLRGGRLPECTLACERSGKYRPFSAVVGRPLTKNTGTKKCDCPFRLKGIPLPPYGVQWRLAVKCGLHNHPPSEFLDNHEYPSRLKPEEKQWVVDMAGMAAPRELLSQLKEIDPGNTTNIRTIYNTIARDKTAKRGSLSHTQFALAQLIDSDYWHAIVQHPATKEVTDIMWAHPQSIELYFNFPTVLIMDATYKITQYRLPLLEIVGITSTHLTYSVAFIHLSDETEERFTWALSTLRQWLVKRGATMPSVVVSDRDLALMNAIGTCFPTARHLLCIWHINQRITERCKRLMPDEDAWESFLVSWNGLVKSSTEDMFRRRWRTMRRDFQEFTGATSYLENTWITPYGQRFVVAWINDCMHLGTNSSQRVESAHARLKKYLGDTMSTLDTAYAKIDKMLEAQFAQIRGSFETSIHIPRHRATRIQIFAEICGRVSQHALDIMYKQYDYISQVDPGLAGCCRCILKTTMCLPCMHDIAGFEEEGRCIPLSAIHEHWKRLSMNAPVPFDEDYIPDRTPQVVGILSKLNPQMREHMIDKFINMAEPSQSSVRDPPYNTTTKGRPEGEERSGRRKKSAFEHFASKSDGRSARRSSTSFDRYIQQLPAEYRNFVFDIVDVMPDGNCGYRCIAACLGIGEEGWAQVRIDMIAEIRKNRKLYAKTWYQYGDGVDYVLSKLNHFNSPADREFWMEQPIMGLVIASAYNVVLHTFGFVASTCFTHLPLRTRPGRLEERREIAIAHVNNCHFVQVILRPNSPVPPVIRWWHENKLVNAEGWEEGWGSRLELWWQMMSCRGYENPDGREKVNLTIDSDIEDSDD